MLIVATYERVRCNICDPDAAAPVEKNNGNGGELQDQPITPSETIIKGEKNSI